MAKDRELLKFEIENTYDPDALLRLWSNSLGVFVSANIDDFKDVFTNYLSSKRPSVSTIVEILAMIIGDKRLFLLFLEKFSPNVRRAIEYLVRKSGWASVREIEEANNIRVLFPDAKKMVVSTLKKADLVGNILPEYIILPFRIEKSWEIQNLSFTPTYYFSVPPRMARHLKNYLFEPEEYDYQPLSSVGATDFIYHDNGQILRTFPLLLGLFSTSEEIYGKNRQFLKMALNRFASVCQADDFYPKGSIVEDELIVMKLLIKIVEPVYHHAKTEPLQFLKTIIDMIRLGIFDATPIILYYLKGFRKSENSEIINKFAARNFLSVLQELPLDAWISVERLLHVLQLREIDIEPLERSIAAHSVSIVSNNPEPHKKEMHWRFYNPHIATYANKLHYDDIVLVPFIKGMFFLFAKLGLVNIAYDLPQSKVYKVENRDYLSIWDGLRYVSISKLGAYILGKTQEYSQELIEQEIGKVIFDEERLLIYLEGNIRMERMIIEKFAEKISPMLYKVTHDSFLSGCKRKADIDLKIKNIAMYLSPNLPQNWQDFINNILSKTEPLKLKQDIRVFALSKNKELLELFLKDKELKNLVYKVEDYQVAIPVKNQEEVRKRLLHFGFLATELFR